MINVSLTIFLVLIPHLLFGVAFYLRSQQVSNWIIRKTIHVAGLIIVAIYGVLIDEVTDLLLVGALLIGSMVLLSVPPIRYMQNLTQMSTREDESGRMSFFTVLITQITVWTLWFVIPDQEMIFFGSVMALAIGDGLGEFIGKPFGKHTFYVFSQKSVEGSIAVFVGILSSGLLSILLFGQFTPKLLLLVIVMSIFLTLVEIMSTAFIDNILIPILYTLTFLIFG